MADIDLKTETPDTTLPTTGFLFGADSQAAASPSVYSTQTVATTLLGSTTLTGATVTTSQPVIDASQTWNDGGVTFTGLKFNAATGSNTGSAAGSLLMDLQLEGNSLFRFGKDGRIYVTGGSSRGLYGYSPSTSGGIAINGSAVLILENGQISTSATLVLNGSTLRFSSDLFLTRRAAANLRLGAADAAAPVAQTLSVQSVVAGTSNTAGANLTITGSQGTGTGAGGSIIFQVAPAGSSGTAQNALADALTINGDQTVQFASTIALGGSSGATLFKQNASNYIEAGTGFSIEAGGGSGIAMMKASGGNHFNAGQNAYYGWNGINGVSTPDLRLYRDAANTLALRNAAAAQAFRVYNTYTSATDFERANIFWNSNVLKIGTEKGSAGGTARALEFQTDGTTRLTIAANSTLTHTASGGEVFTIATNGAVTVGRGLTIAGPQAYYFLGRSGILSPSDGVIRLSNNAVDNFDRLQFGGTTSSFPALKRNSTALETKLADDSAYAPHAMQYLDVTDGITAPASATGRARIYVDTADGDLKVIFADGTVKTIVTDT